MKISPRGFDASLARRKLATPVVRPKARRHGQGVPTIKASGVFGVRPLAGSFLSRRWSKRYAGHARADRPARRLLRGVGRERFLKADHSKVEMGGGGESPGARPTSPRASCRRSRTALACGDLRALRLTQV